MLAPKGCIPDIRPDILTALPSHLYPLPRGRAVGEGLRAEAASIFQAIFCFVHPSYQLCQALPVKSTLLSFLKTDQHA
jgi:hypothetical protein